MKSIQTFNLLLFVLFLVMILSTACVRIHVHADLPPIQNSELQCPSCPSAPHETTLPLDENTQGIDGPMKAISTGSFGGEQTTIPLRIKKHKSVVLTEEEASKILEHATDVAKHEDQCNLKLERDGEGDIEKFTWPQEGETPGVISSRFDFEIVTGLPGVKVVQDVQWCDRPGPFMGCAELPGEALAVEMYRDETGDMEPFYDLLGVLWLHEVGHNKNNTHRLHPPGVMHPQIFQEHKELTPNECANYHQP